MCTISLWKRFVSLLCVFGIVCLASVQPASAAQVATVEDTENDYTYEIEWLNDVDFILRGYLDGVQIEEISGSVGAETMNVKEFSEQGNLVEEETVTVSDIISPAPQEVVDELNESGLDSLEAESRVTTPYVTKHYSGKAFDGLVKEGQYGAWETEKAYEGYYPQFIREHDTAVATWLFNDFFDGSFNVYRWESAI